MWRCSRIVLLAELEAKIHRGTNDKPGGDIFATKVHHGERKSRDRKYPWSHDKASKNLVPKQKDEMEKGKTEKRIWR